MFIDKSMTGDIISIGPETGVLEAFDLMKKHRIRHLPVVDKDNFILGIVSDRDIRSAMPPPFLTKDECEKAQEGLSKLNAECIMTKDVMTISTMDTIQDALLLMYRVKVSAFPVVGPDGKLTGILSIHDIIRAFIKVLGIEEPGTLLGILVDDKLGQTKMIVDAITEEGIPFGSILVARHWEDGKRAVFPYLLSTNVARIKKKFQKMGFTLLNPLDWSIDRHQKESLK
jgi:acetoin utilization protein AcuB